MPHNPTRLPYGLSYVKPGANATDYTLVAGDQTPDVSYGTYFVTAASAITITNFDGGERGKLIYLRCNTGGAVTIQDSAGGINIENIVMASSGGALGVLIYSATGGNAIMLNKEVMGFAHNGTDWDYIGIRTVINTLV